MGNNTRNRHCQDCGIPTFHDRCQSCSAKKKITDYPELTARRDRARAAGRKRWIGERRMAYLKKVIGEPKDSYTFTAADLAKVIYTHYQQGHRQGYVAGYMQARRRVAAVA